MGLDAQATEPLRDLRAAAVHQHRIDAESLQPDDVVEHGALFADGATDFDDNRLADVLADVRQRFEQRLGFLVDRELGDGHVEYELFSTTYASVRSHPQARASLLPRPRPTRICTSAPCICARASSFETPVRMPSRATWTEPIHSAARAASTWADELPTAAKMRPQLGSSPCSAALTRLEPTTARAAARASASLAAPVTSTWSSFEAPSPSAAILRARSVHTASSASANRSASADDASSVGAPDRPLASRKHESLVLVSPSTVIMLKVRSTTRLSVARAKTLSRFASVPTNASIVAMLG